METFQFQAEARQVLDLMIHSLYTQKEIFLRELISNASDALDRLRFEALSRPELIGPDEKLEVWIESDPEARTLTISDNGIGMSREEVIANIGTIAKNGGEGVRERGGGLDRHKVRFSDVIAVNESKSRFGLTVGDAARDTNDVVVESASKT